MRKWWARNEVQALTLLTIGLLLLFVLTVMTLETISG